MIFENMPWPPNIGVSRWKIEEYSAWYSGDANILANFYAQLTSSNFMGLPYTLERDLFWARQIKNHSEIGLHVPIAGDIAETSADLLFSEPPQIKIAEAHVQNASKIYVDSQDVMSDMLDKSGFYRRILECAETCSAMGGGFIKLAWDEELSPYPIPVVEQIDNAIPEFKFGVLTKVVFWKTLDVSGDGHKIRRLLETYSRDGSITYQTYLGSGDKLGKLVATEGYTDTYTSVKDLLAVYVPNVLPNRLNRSAYVGRSDYAGIEGLMDAFDECYSSWMKDIVLAQGKVMVPEEFLKKTDTGYRYNVDQMIFAKLDMDPTLDGNKLTPVQFAIRADEFEKTSQNLLERIISSAGYSPQSFGLQIRGRAETATALNIRERKSFATRNKKEAYWEPALKRLVGLMLALYKVELNGTVEADVTITTQFSDSITNDINEVSTAVQKISAAMAASTETKVRLLHPDWSEAEVIGEVEKIISENGLSPVTEPDDL